MSFVVLRLHYITAERAAFLAVGRGPAGTQGGKKQFLFFSLCYLRSQIYSRERERAVRNDHEEDGTRNVTDHPCPSLLPLPPLIPLARPRFRRAASERASDSRKQGKREDDGIRALFGSVRSSLHGFGRKISAFDPLLPEDLVKSTYRAIHMMVLWLFNQ